ncbi:hypothetical protein [Pedobacter cryophilus]|uniref:Uncharacterized protein n=1 Tax=Pedobacter cryophilus TaxID=2571271 RepID=A0A4V5NXK9_9SPHI|nr:hypothetical protein [Pedobacter cryophilus]TKB98843.1 hypothetical protein FA046_06935 [Pedobacter cryophilus]
MKIKIQTIIFLFTLLSLFSCEKDNSNSTLTNNNVTYNNLQFKITKGIFIDYGASCYYGNTNTHYNYDFFITDGDFISDANGNLIDVKGDIVIYAYLESFGKDSFKTGTYTCIDSSTDNELNDTQLKTKYENKSFIMDAYVITDENAKESLSTGKQVLVKSGTITLAGIQPNFTITYDLILLDNKTVKGSYKGDFSELAN